MIQVRLLTLEQKNLILGKSFNYSSKFNPIQDANDNWIISEEEVQQNIFSRYDWIQSLPQIEYIPRLEMLIPFV